MDFVSLLSSISRLAVFAFVVTLGIILVEIYLMSRKEKKEVKKDISVPDFSDTGTAEDMLHIEQPEVKPIKKSPSKLPRIALNIFAVLALIGIAGGGFYIYWNYLRPEPIQELAPLPDQPEPTTIADEGIVPTSLQPSDVPTSPFPTVIEPTDPLFNPDREPTVLISVPITEIAPSSGLIVSPTKVAEPTDTEESIAQNPSPTLIAKGGSEATNTPRVTLPVAAGAYNITLIMGAASLAVIVLALML